jgi:tetratricopeptide (TPR) repeat protein
MSQDALLSRIKDRNHSIAVGAIEPPAKVLYIAVHGDLPGPPLAPLLQLCEDVESLLGEPLVEATAPRRFGEPRATSRMYPGRLVGTLNRLATAIERPVAVWIHAFDRLDPASRDLVTRALREPGWLRLPLVLAVEPGAIADSLAELLGADSVIEGARVEEPATPELPDLSDDVLRVLRAGAVAGDVFHVETVADLLVADPVSVLEFLQVARDRGVPLVDRGDGILALPPALAARLRDNLLPSLRQAWHQLLATAHADRLEPPAALARPTLPAPPPPLPDLDHIFGPPETADDIEAMVEEAASTDARPPLPWSKAAPAPASAVDHAVNAGLLEDAIANLLSVAQQATDAGAFTDALGLLDRAETEAGKIPSTRRVAELRAQIELERGTIDWVGIGSPGGDEPLTLARAVEHLDRALEQSEALGDVALGAEVRATLAAVCIDLGDRVSLERAVALLTDASRTLSEAGLSMEAAQLLNEQASVWVRLGDPVRAYGLLSASRRIFERFEGPEGVLEIAGTDHQTARLALHAEARPGRAADAVEVGMQMGRRAAEVYARMGIDGELARTLETIGRLALRGDRGPEAEAALRQAFAIQLERRDGIGLARTTAALADLAARAGDRPGALEALAESVELNVAKGSPIGLAFNLESLERIDPDGSSPASRELADRIRAAQADVGVVKNPGALYHGAA